MAGSVRPIAALRGSAGDAAHGGARSGNGVGGDPESHILILHLPGSRPPAWLTADLKAGFHTPDTDSDRLRVYTGSGLGLAITRQDGSGLVFSYRQKRHT